MRLGYGMRLLLIGEFFLSLRIFALGLLSVSFENNLTV